MSETERLEKELGRAYRALQGFYRCIANGRVPDRTMLVYHSPAVGAALRYVDEGALDGADYFTGKHISVLHEVLGRAVSPSHSNGVRTPE